MVSKKILRMEVQNTPIQKTYEINVCQDSIKIDFLGANRQFDWLEMFLVFDKSDKSYNIELTVKYINSVKLSNFTKIYRLTNEKKNRHRQFNTKTFVVQTICCLGS